MHREISVVDGVQFTTDKHQKLIDKAFPDNDTKMVTYHRNPTAGEIRFGEGATHYKDFALPFCRWLDGSFKQWLVCPLDGLRYYKG